MAITILEALTSFFTQDNWNFNHIEGDVLELTFQGDNEEWVCYAQAREAESQFIFYSVCPVITPSDKLPAVMEFITRANFGLMIGNFEIDLDDGEIRYKTSIQVKDSNLNAELIKPLVYANVLTMNKYLSGIIKVIYNNEVPKKILSQIEAQ